MPAFQITVQCQTVKHAVRRLVDQNRCPKLNSEESVCKKILHFAPRKNFSLSVKKRWKFFSRRVDWWTNAVVWPCLLFGINSNPENRKKCLLWSFLNREKWNENSEKNPEKCEEIFSFSWKKGALEGIENRESGCGESVMPIRKPSYNSSRLLSRVTTKRTTKRTILISRSNRIISAEVKKIKKPQLAQGENFPSPPVIQKNNSSQLRLPNYCVEVRSRTKDRRIPATNKNGSSNCTIVIRSSSSGSRIKWTDCPSVVFSENKPFEPLSENCCAPKGGTALFSSLGRRSEEAAPSEGFSKDPQTSVEVNDLFQQAEG